MTDRGAIEEDVSAFVAAYLEVADAADETGYEPVDSVDGLPARARAEATVWCRQLLAAAVDPYRTPASHALHRAGAATYDLVRHDRLDEEGRSTLVVIESRIFLLARVPGAAEGWDGLSVEARAARLAEHARWIFAGSLATAPWSPTGDRFTTAPGVHLLTMPSPDVRADAGVQGDAIWFLTYRKPSSALSPLDPRGWFV